MKALPKTKQLIPIPKHAAFVGGILLFAAIACNTAYSYETYNGSGDPGCVECHGDFRDAISTKGSIFALGNKHDMHRTTMGTACDLCHASSGGRADPSMGSSKGTVNNPGLGCTGCHVAEGLRAHHAINNVVDSKGDSCVDCHDDGTPPAENIVNPEYYGTVDTLANNPCNDALVSNTNENWTVGDFLGLDNDGDNLYDLADFNCGPAYQIAAIAIEGGNVRITWDTVGGRRDMLQSAPSLTESFSDVGSALTIPGVGVATTNSVEVGGVTASNRFYRIRYAP